MVILLHSHRSLLSRVRACSSSNLECVHFYVSPLFFAPHHVLFASSSQYFAASKDDLGWGVEDPWEGEGRLLDEIVATPHDKDIAAQDAVQRR